MHKRYAQCRGTDTVLRTLAHLLAAHSRATPKQAKEPKPAKGKVKNVPMSEILTVDFIKNLEGSVGLYELTNKGRNFVLSNQVIDEDGKKLRREHREKWFDRIFGFVAGIVATLLAAWLLKLM
jgi:hypothetical protein